MPGRSSRDAFRILGAVAVLTVWPLVPELVRAEHLTVPVRFPAAAEHAGSLATDSTPGVHFVWVVIPRGHDVIHVEAALASASPASASKAAPVPRATITGVAAWRGYQVAFVRLDDPEEARIEGAGGRELHVELETAPTRVLPLARQRFNPVRLAEDAARVRARVANPADVERFAPPAGRLVSTRRGFHPAAYPDLEGSDVEYVIVTNEALAPAFQVLADWKTRRGVPTVVRTVESIEATVRHGSDLQQTIRTFLQDAYAKWSLNWVLLAGDTDIIPARYLSSSFGLTVPEQIPSDLYFAGLDGSWNADGDALWGEAPASSTMADPDGGDLLADVYVARAPVNTPAQVSAFVQKVIAYETPNDPTYQENTLFMGEVLFPTNWTQGENITMDGAQLSESIIVARVPPMATLQRLYEDYLSFPGSQPLTRAACMAEMNAGCNLTNHVGHGFRYNMSVGDASLVNSDADALQNQDRYMVLNVLNCTSLAFDFPCLGEHFVNNPTGGAVAVVGASRSAYPLPAHDYQDDWYDQVYNHGVWHVGELFDASRLNQTPQAALEGAYRWTHYIYNILGEPEMTVFDALPVQTVVSVPPSVGLGPQNVTVSVTLPGGAPVEGARVCLQKGDEDYVHGVTASDGQVTFAFTPESAGDIDVTVSGRDLQTFLGTIAVVAPPASYVHLESVSLDDDATGGTNGNADGVLDAGETVDLTLTLRNDGSAASDTIQGLVTTSDPYVTVLTPAFTRDALGPGGSGTAASAVRLQLATGAPDHHVFELVLSMTSGTTTTEDRLKREIHAPVLDLVRLEVLDGLTGNGDGQIQESEIFQLRCWVKNFGSGRVDGLNGLLMTSSFSVTLYQTSTSYGTIAPMAENGGGVLFKLSEDILEENWINLRLTDNRGRLVVQPFELRGPATPSGLTLDPTTGPTVVLATWQPVGDADLAGYHVYRGPTAAGPWTRVTVDPTDKIAYYRDGGLASSTQYWYTVTSIDASGNESLRAPALSVSTNPPQVEGWPIAMPAETSSSPAIGDLDGDGLMEIVQGNSQIYAWHGTGDEVVDADQNAQTWGVFTTATGTVTGSILLAELDGSPGLEVFACNWSDNGVFAVDGDGQLLWTHSPANGGQPGYWATPAAADVDRDGRVEIFAPSKDGHIYAWHADGTPLLPAHPDGWFADYAAYTRSSPALGNLDDDFDLEIVEADVGGNLYAWNPDGSNVPGFPKAFGVAFNNSPLLGDVDGDGMLDIVAVHQSGANNLHCLHRDGSEFAGFPITVTLKTSPVSPTPALADLDGDGKLEIVVASCDYSASTGKVFVYRFDGTSYAGWPQSTFTDSESSPIIADLDGDGAPDVVYGGQDGILRGWNRDGLSLLGFPISVGDFVRATPAVGDVDGDGDTDLVLAGWDKNVWVWDLPSNWDPTLAPWPAYLHDAQRTGQAGFVVKDATDTEGTLPPPRQLELLQNRPNPFNPTTEIRFGSPVAGTRVRLDIFDVRGRRIQTLLDGPLGAGRHRAVWNGLDAAGQRASSGVYFYRLSWDGRTQTRRMLLLK